MKIWKYVCCYTWEDKPKVAAGENCVLIGEQKELGAAQAVITAGKQCKAADPGNVPSPGSHLLAAIPTPARKAMKRDRSKAVAEAALHEASDAEASDADASPSRRIASSLMQQVAVAAAQAADPGDVVLAQQIAAPPSGEVPDECSAAPGVSLLDCPWCDGLSQFVAMEDLRQLCCAGASLREQLTVQGSDGQRLLVVPALELYGEDPADTMSRISPPHVKILRLWKRRSYDVVEQVVQAGGPTVLQSLERIAIKGCPLDGNDMRMVLQPVFSLVGGLKHINLEKNQLNDAFIKEFVSSGAFAAARPESMNLRMNSIGPEGAEALASCTEGFSRMQWLNLKNNRIGDEGALALATMLETNDSLTMLNLRVQMPSLTDRAAVGFAEALRWNKTIDRLRLRRNKIGDAGAIALAGAVGERLAKIRAREPDSKPKFELDLESNRVKVDGALALLAAVDEAPSNREKIEILLHGNFIDSKKVVELGANPSNRVLFVSKPETEV